MSGFLESLRPMTAVVKKYRIEFLLIALAIATALTSLLIYFNSLSPTASEDIIAPKETNIMVEVAGAVTRPAVYEITASARLKDVLALAGGLSDEVDYPYFQRNFNLARQLTDQEKIYIPFLTETPAGSAPDNQKMLGKLNINRASREELDNLPGIGPVTAAKIVQNRPYGAIDELLNKKILRKNIYDQIKDLISL